MLEAVMRHSPRVRFQLVRDDEVTFQLVLVAS